MTDGTTGFQVAPITEDDMSRVHSILKRAADAIVGMSQLQADVQMLRDTVSGLQADADRLRSQNNALDEALNHSRQVRDEQGRKLAETDHMLIVANDQAIKYMAERDALDQANHDLSNELAAVKTERDDAQFQVLDLTDKLASAEAKLAKVAELHKAIFPEPEAKPEPPKANPVTVGEDVAYGYPKDDGTPKTEAVQPLTDTRPDSQDHWDPGYCWDQATLKYWREGVTPKADGEAIPF